MDTGLVSIIIPAKNEEQNILPTLNNIEKEFNGHNVNYEVIVVNDGSQDTTQEIVQKFHQKNSRIRVVNSDYPCGVGYAIRKGLDIFKGDMVIIVMADASDDPKDMLQYIRYIREGYDCCFGDRWQNKKDVFRYPLLKRILNRLANGGMRVLFQLKYNDVTNAFKAYSRETIEGIKPILSRHFNVTVELPLKVIVRGYTYKVIPTKWYNRRQGTAHFKIKEMGSRYFFIIVYIFLEKLLCGQDYKKT